jgi:ABC-type antimicrobial peptide transport system permease subunit
LVVAGIFGLIAFTLTRRTRKIGIRMALGADRIEVIVAVARESIVFTLIGLAVGSLVSLDIVRMLSSLMFGGEDLTV